MYSEIKLAAWYVTPHLMGLCLHGREGSTVLPGCVALLLPVSEGDLCKVHH